MSIVYDSASTAFRSAHCLHCDREIVLDPRVGWIETYPGVSYTECPSGVYGVHVPDPNSDSQRPYWMPFSRARGAAKTTERR